MTNDAFFKPSLGIEKFVPEDYSLDTERFVAFLRAYYEWLQTTKITITGISGTFVRDETVTASAGGTGIIKEIGSGYIVVRMTSRLPFNRAETITGGTSGATASISTITDNVIRASGNLTNYKNFELSIDKYFNYLQDELFPSLPATVYGDKRLLATKYKQFFESRSNEESYRFLFKHLYNEDVEFYYPGEDVLRVSDGNFEKTQVLRAVVTENIFDFVNKTVRGITSGSLANVVDIKVFTIGSIEVAEMTLKLVSGTFQAGETIVDIEDDDLTTTLYGMITGFVINDGGSGYSVGDEVVITGDGSDAEVIVSSVKDSPISALKINEIGYGYRNNTLATINNTGTGGSGLIVKVTGIANTYSVTSGNNIYTVGEISRIQIISRGENYFSAPTITVQDATISSLGLLSDKLITIANTGTDYTVGDALVFTGGSGANAAGQIASVVANSSYSNTLLFEDEFELLLEQSYDDKLKSEDWDLGQIGPIARIELTNFGTGYETANLPSITVTTATGSGANLIATNIQGKSANVEVDVANNATGIGAIRALEIKNFGIDYSTATANTSLIGNGNANLTPIITGIGTKEGNWIDDDGKIDYKYIQDSFFYQDFSYVIKSGLTFNFYKNTIKKIIHPAGLQPFGEILLFDSISVSPNIVVTIETEAQEIIDFIIKIFSLLDVSMVVADAASINMIINQEANVQSNLFGTNEYVIKTPFFTQMEMSYQQTSIDRILEPIVNVTTNFDEKYTITITPKDSFVYLIEQIPTQLPFYQLQISIIATNVISEFSSNVLTDIYNFLLPTVVRSFGISANLESVTATSYGAVQYQDTYLWSQTIDSLSSNTFLDNYIESSNIAKNVKVTGNVTITNTDVVGLGTSFLTDFAAFDYLIVNNSEKFIINSISNNNFMTINVVPSASYIGADAYKEQIS